MTADLRLGRVVGVTGILATFVIVPLHAQETATVSQAGLLEVLEALDSAWRIESYLLAGEDRHPSGLAILYSERKVRRCADLDSLQREELRRIVADAHEDTRSHGYHCLWIPWIKILVHDQEPPLEMVVSRDCIAWRFRRGATELHDYNREVGAFLVVRLKKLCRELQSGEFIPEPRPIKIVPPVWPEYAMRQRAGGRALIECEVGDGGRLKDCVIVDTDSTGYFGETSLRAAERSQYEPQSSSGASNVGRRVRISFRYTLDMGSSLRFNHYPATDTVEVNASIMR